MKFTNASDNNNLMSSHNLMNEVQTTTTATAFSNRSSSNNNGNTSSTQSITQQQQQQQQQNQATQNRSSPIPVFSSSFSKQQQQQKQTKTTTANTIANSSFVVGGNQSIITIPTPIPASLSTTISSSASSSASASTSSSTSSSPADASAIAKITATTTQTATSTTTTTALFCEQVTTVTNLFEKWNDCERTVVMYALLKRLRYPTLKFLQYSIDNNLSQNMGSQANLSTVVVDINANNVSYLQNLLNVYKNLQPSDLLDTMSSSSSDKDSMPCYGSDFQITTSAQCDERKLVARKEDILHEVLNMLPLLKPGNDEAKAIYTAFIPVSVKDTMQQIVSTELVQQIFSYLLIHPSVTSEDRRSLNIWLRHLEDHIQASVSGMANQSYFLQPSPRLSAEHLASTMSTSSASSNMSSSASSSSAASCSSASNVSMASSSMGNLANNTCSTASTSSQSGKNSTRDWQTIAPPSKQHHHNYHQQSFFQNKPASTHSLHDWSSISVSSPTAAAAASSSTTSVVKGTGVGNSVSGGSNSSSHNGSINALCDNFNGITLNELASSQNSLGLSIGAGIADSTSSILVNGVAAAANVTAGTGGLFGSGNGSMMGLLSGGSGRNSGHNNSLILNNDDNENSFSKNGTEILDFEPSTLSFRDEFGISNSLGQSEPQNQGYASILMGNMGDQFGGEMTRWSLDSKIAALKTRRSNSLTTQTISSTSSSSNSSVITVNDNCSNSTENLAQFANKPRSFSLSIEHQRGGALTNSGSDTRLDDYKPNYIKFQTRNVGMSGIGLWLKSLRLHKYIELFKNMTYEEMMQITEEFLQSVGVTKGASHKLALCIEKLKERAATLSKMEQDFHRGQIKMSTIVEELTNIVLTPMKPIDSVLPNSGEDNVGMCFLRLVDLVGNALQKDPFADDEALSIFMWILDRSIHNEAFVSHANHIKELKFKLSKLKISIAPKLHHMKSGVNPVNLNKPRWNAKNRKCDPKNGSNDRINHRKNSNEMLNFSLNCLSGQGHHHQQQQQQSFASSIDYNSYGSPQAQQAQAQQSHQYKSSSYPNFLSTQQQQQQSQLKHYHQSQTQSHPQPQNTQPMHHLTQPSGLFPVMSQQTPPPSQPHHRRSLNNLIVVSGGPQQVQQMIFKPGHGIVSADKTDAITMPTRTTQRKPSLNGLSSNNLTGNVGGVGAVGADNGQSKKAMTNVVMVGKNNEDQQQPGRCTVPNTTPPQILISNNNNSNMLNNNLFSEQQMQLLAAAAAAAGNSLTAAAAAITSMSSCCGHNCLCVSSCNSCAGVGVGSNSIKANNNKNNNNNENNTSTTSSSCIINNQSGGGSNNCCNNYCLNSTNNLAEPPQTQPQLIANMNISLKDKYQTSSSSPPVSSAVSALNAMNDYKKLEQLETLCLQMTEQAIN